LHTVGISLAIVRAVDQADIGLRRIIHKTFSVAAAEET
jgi:hypothetical protein